MFGLADAAPMTPTEQAVNGFLIQTPDPSATDIMSFLKLYGDDERPAIGAMLVSLGVSADSVSTALSWLNTTSRFKGASAIWGVLSIASAAASGYHGYRRNNSIGWGLAWFAIGSIFPVITPTIAIAQGFGKKAG